MSSARIFRYFKTLPEVIRIAVMLCVRFPLSVRNVEQLPHGRGIDITRKTVRFWRGRFGRHFAAGIRFNQGRELISRQTVKDHRDAALQAWRTLGVA